MSFAQFHVEETARVARKAHARLMQTAGAETLRVYYKPLALEVFAEGEEIDRSVWNLAFPEPIPTNLEQAQLIAWIRYRADRVPYLPWV